ncbi:transposase [Streptomyces sp. NBC_00414]|uniref:transposase n=1 Tax=Streptomyces sp. NBC_00414 TaxID=2975739 RepID=UPI003FA6F54E
MCRSSAWTRCSSGERITSRRRTRSRRGGIAGADRTHVPHWFVDSYVTGRGDLTEAGWRRLEPLLPTGNNLCGRWRDHRQAVNDILHRVRTGVQWRDRLNATGRGRPWVRLCARLAEVVQEVRRSVAPEEASPPRFT